MTAARYKPGDRVRARVSALLVPAGTLGTVTTVYPTRRDAYEVRFDGRASPILMWEDELELVDRPADDTPQP
jgi:hypothetical protein